MRINFCIFHAHAIWDSSVKCMNSFFANDIHIH